MKNIIFFLNILQFLSQITSLMRRQLLLCSVQPKGECVFIANNAIDLQKSIWDGFLRLFLLLDDGSQSRHAEKKNCKLGAFERKTKYTWVYLRVVGCKREVGNNFSEFFLRSLLCELNQFTQIHFSTIQ